MSAVLEVLRPGALSTVQDWPGRTALWAVGVPPSGPMDDRAFRAANQIAGNAPGVPAVEITLAGPTLRLLADATVAIAGAPIEAEADGVPVPMWQARELPAGATLRLGRIRGPGMRAYLAIAGGVASAGYLGSAATFTLGGFGGPAGRPLARGDVLELAREPAVSGPGGRPDGWSCSTEWTLRVVLGPQAGPEYFADLDALLEGEWTVHHHSDRTGVRLTGPAPRFARPDGADAGLHPSNVHDNAYALGAVTFAGDAPLIIGPDGPSLGGFVAPACVIEVDRWKLGQLRPGDAVRFRAVALAKADLLAGRSTITGALPAHGTLERTGVACDGCPVSITAAGDAALLVEFGRPELDLALRVHAHSLRERLAAAETPGLRDLTEGIRSLQVAFDPARIERSELVALLAAAAEELPDPHRVEIPARTLHLPLSWDDPAAQRAVDRYAQTVRADAPWCPSNLEFIRRINGLDSVEEVRRIVFDATYLVMGLGDVYLGAPVALPLDPRHRLVTTKYTPPRTWTPESAVGIGGSYLCIYGIEGPGGYQLLGRTLPVWNTHHVTADFRPGRPWLLRAFDHLRFEPVGAQELEQLRADFLRGRHTLRRSEHTFRLAGLPRSSDPGIAEVLAHRRRAFLAERRRWQEALAA